GAGRPYPADDGGFAVESKDTDLHMRLHGGARPEADNYLLPHGQAQGGGPRRIREAGDLDVLPVGVDPRAGDSAASEPADLLSGGRWDEVADELLDADVDLVANPAHRVQVLAGRIIQLPIFISLARVDRAAVAAAHRYHDVGCADIIVCQRFWELSADVKAHLAHRLDHARIQ